MRHMVAFTVIVSVAGCTSAAVPNSATPVPSASVTTLYARIPAAIGGFTLTERTAVQGLPMDSVFRFRDSSKTNVSVIIYDVPADVKVDADSQKWTPREGEKFKTVVELLKNRGQIVEYAPASSDTTRFAVEARTVLEHSIAVPVRFPNGAIAVEMQYLYLIGGRFVKVRGTIPEQGWRQTGVPSFAKELARRIARGI